MKFSTAVLTFSIFAIANAGVSKPVYYKPKNDGAKGLDTVDYEFALGVREKCDDNVIYLAFEIDDGQLEHDTRTVDCKCDDKHKYPGKGHGKYDKRGYSYPTPVDYFCKIDKSECTDTFTLCDGILKDDCYRIGEIVANHQFQFDNPVQPDALKTCGWSIVKEDDVLLLALDGCTDFWECAVDDCGTYKLYDSCIGAQCKEVEIIIILIEEDCPPKPTQVSEPDCEDDCEDDHKQKQPYKGKGGKW